MSGKKVSQGRIADLGGIQSIVLAKLKEMAGGFADAAPQTDMTVSFSEQAIAFCQAQKQLPDLQIFIEKVLKQDPRPPYKKQRGEQQSYGMTLYNFNIKWTVDGEHNHVTEIRLQQTPTTTPADDAG